MKKKLIRGAEIALTVMTFAVLMVYGGWTGLSLKEYSVDLVYLVIDVAVADAVSSTAYFTLVITLTGLIQLIDASKPIEEWRSTYKGKKVSAIVPVYKDADVMHQSVETILESNYNNLEVVIVYEPDDKSSKEKAEKLSKNKENVTSLENGNPGSKPKAINYAIEKSETPYCALFDADEEIDRTFLSAGVSYLEEDGYEIFQGRRIPKINGIIEAFCYCERAIFYSSFTLFARLGFKIPRSSSTVMKKEAWEKAEGYSDMLTEDLDFPHKCYRRGISVKQSYNHTNVMEAPHTPKDFWGQRKRWSIGQMQIAHKILKGGFSNNRSFRGLVSSVGAIISLLLRALLLALVAKFMLLLFFGFEAIYLPPLLALSLVTLSLSFVDYRRGKTKLIGAKSLMTPFVVIVSGILTIKCFFEYLITWEGEWYHVEK